MAAASVQAPQQPWDARAGTWQALTPHQEHKSHGRTPLEAKEPETDARGLAPREHP